MKKYDVTVVIPAHNEEKYVARCIRSIKKSAANFGGSVEMIVVCNRCTDKTAEIAEKNGARVLFNDDRCIALVRNTGKKSGRKYTVLKKNYLINSTRKYDDLGDWLYFRLIFENFGTMIKAAFGKNEDYDRLLDKMFYDYNS